MVSLVKIHSFRAKIQIMRGKLPPKKMQEDCGWQLTKGSIKWLHICINRSRILVHKLRNLLEGRGKSSKDYIGLQGGRGEF